MSERRTDTSPQHGYYRGSFGNVRSPDVRSRSDPNPQTNSVSSSSMSTIQDYDYGGKPLNLFGFIRCNHEMFFGKLYQSTATTKPVLIYPQFATISLKREVLLLEIFSIVCSTLNSSSIFLKNPFPMSISLSCSII